MEQISAVGSLFQICYNIAIWKVFGKWRHFQISLLLREMQVIRYFSCVRDIGEKYLSRLLDCCCCLSWKVATRGLRKFYRKTPVLEALFNKVAGPTATFLKRDSNTGAFSMKFPKLFQKQYLWTSASLPSQVILFTTHGNDTANEA